MSDQAYLKLETADFNNKMVSVYLTTSYHSSQDDSLRTVTLLCALKRRRFETLKVPSVKKGIS